MDKSKVLAKITQFYIDSADYNGIKTSSIQSEYNLSNDDLNSLLTELVSEESVYISFPSVFCNPYIRAFDGPTSEKQIEIMNTEGLDNTCLYPTSNVLRSIVGDKYKDAPYTQEMKLGEPRNLPALFFDMAILEKYYNDPRYYYKFEDYTGSIYICDEYVQSGDLSEHNKIHLKSFGLGYSEKGKRVITVFRYYLSCLSPEQQQYWKFHQIADNCRISELYYKNMVLGQWCDSVSIYVAFIEEQVVINKMCEAMGKPLLFRKTFEDNRPKEFSILLRPTLDNYYSFIHILDKMISDNINKDFFFDEVEFKTEKERKDGKIEISHKGTLQLLKEYLRKNIRVPDDSIFDEIIKPLKKVRELRQKPAHNIEKNRFDTPYFKQQDDLIQKVYFSLSFIRYLFSLHFATKSVEIPEWLEEAKIFIC